MVEHEYLEPSVKIRKRTESISLGDFDPAKVQVPPDSRDAANNPVFTVQMERSDSVRKIQAAMEMKDGSKKTVLLASDFFYMDSRDVESHLLLTPSKSPATIPFNYHTC